MRWGGRWGGVAARGEGLTVVRVHILDAMAGEELELQLRDAEVLVANVHFESSSRWRRYRYCGLAADCGLGMVKCMDGVFARGLRPGEGS